MGNVFRILKRDVLRLVKAPAALIVVGALMVLPSLYSWYNVLAFWNPYEATGNLTVCIVNEDSGAENDLTGPLNVGNLLEEELHANEQLHFISEARDQAMADLEAGRVCAVYVVPENFTECLISPLSGQVKTPQILYFANEKLGPVSPKITDTAASTLDQTINSLFVAKVSEKAAEAVDEAAHTAEGDIADARSQAMVRIATVSSAVEEARAGLADVRGTVSDASGKAESAKVAMGDALTLTSDARVLLEDVSSEVGAVQRALSDTASGTVGSLSDILADVSQVTAKVSTAADGFVIKAGTAQSRVDLAAGKVQPVVDAMTSIAADLSEIASHLPEGHESKMALSGSAQGLADRAAKLQDLVDGAQDLSDRIAGASLVASDAASSLEESARQAADTLQGYTDELYGDAAPEINSSLAQVSMACERLASSTSNLDTTIAQAQAGLDQLEDLLGDCGEAIARTGDLIGGLQDDLATISDDVGFLAQSGALASIVNGADLNPESISAFMRSPTQLETERLYHPNAYGAAMAPLFMNLTFWIGAFMLVIIMRLEVDDEGVAKVTLGQRYLSRFLLFSGIAVVQALVCCAGILALGVQAAEVPALFLAAAVCSLAYMSIIYALSANFQHIGKALCIILVFAQIPGGSGLYPLELTDGFFQAIYPFLPFSYGIGALREAIFGFYGNYYVRDLVVLAIMFFGMLVVGMALVPLMSNVTRMAARQIREGDLYNAEEAVMPARPYRLSQVVRALSDREDYREGLERRYIRFTRLYPIFIRVSIVAGVGVPVALVLLLALDAGVKAVLLTVLLAWLVSLVVFLLVVESLRYSFERQLSIEGMSNEKLINVFFDRNRMISALASSTRSRSDAPDADADAPDTDAPDAGDSSEAASGEGGEGGADGEGGEGGAGGNPSSDAPEAATDDSAAPDLDVPAPATPGACAPAPTAPDAKEPNDA